MSNINEQDQGAPVVKALLVGFLLGLLIYWAFDNDNPVKEVEVIKEVSVEDSNGKNYSQCLRQAYQFQNPDFWTGELEGPVPSDEIIKLVDHCLSNQ